MNHELRTVQKTFQSLWECSDFVVIAVPISSKETSVQDEIKGFGKRVECTGVLTTFSVSTVVKGDANIKQFSLFHYQAPDVNEAVFPWFAQFKVQEPGKGRMAFGLSSGVGASYLLYLKAEPQEVLIPSNIQLSPFDWVDYIPTTGQELPGLSVYELHWITTYGY